MEIEEVQRKAVLGSGNNVQNSRSTYEMAGRYDPEGCCKAGKWCRWTRCQVRTVARQFSIYVDGILNREARRRMPDMWTGRPVCDVLLIAVLG